ncbi:MAG: peptidylprolyl isomerase [Bacteroidia bacterium]
MKKLLILLVPALALFTNLTAQAPVAVANDPNDPVLMTIGNTPVRLSEFMYVYKKNNKDQGNDPKAMENYLDLFVTFKMKVKEAEELSRDTVTKFRTELAGYRRQVAQQYLTDKRVNDSLLREAYDRMQYDVRASHILIRLEENALPKDTMLAWMRISIAQALVNGKPATKLISEYETQLRKTNPGWPKLAPADTMKIYNLVNPFRQLDRRYKGKVAPFEEVARLISEEPSAAQSAGDLGYFTAFSMVYPFETVVYNTPVGKISAPLRTRFGYHIVKVADKRKAQGEVLVSHIMIKAPEGMPAADSINARQKADEIYTKAKAGEDFGTLVKQFSDDKGSAAKNGELPWFGLYKMPPAFEKAAFALQNNGDISEPIKTAWGWHIIKRIDRRGVPAYESVKNEIKGKVNKDQRALSGRTALVERVKKEYGFTQNLAARDEFYKLVDSTYFMGQWSATAKAKDASKPLFTIGAKAYTQKDFAAWLEVRQVRRNGKGDVKTVVDQGYNQMVEEMCVAYEDSQLERKYPDFRNLMQEYRDGILLFDLQDEKVWSKAVTDSTGLRSYYEANKNNYLWPERADATVYSCADEKTAKAVRKMLKKGKSEKEILETLNKDSQLNVQTETKLFNKGDNALVDSNWKEGTSANSTKDGRVMFVVTRKVMPPTPKSLQEARGLITNDYQTQLEKEWIESLRKKYPVVINREVLPRK